jgi:tRNA 2-selenouridine synthase
VEAESARIGRLVLPKRVWAAMRAAPRILIEASVEARAAYLPHAYAELIAAPDAVNEAVNRLRPFHAEETIDAWLALAARGAHQDLAARLIREHYDPLYDRSRKRDDRKPIARIRATALTEEGIDAAAAEAADIIRAGSSRSQP